MPASRCVSLPCCVETWRITAVVGQDSADSGVDVEVVVGGDSEVPHPAGTLAGSVAARDNSGCAAGGAEVVAGVEVSGFHPLAGGGVPEQVAGGGGGGGGGRGGGGGGCFFLSGVGGGVVPRNRSLAVVWMTAVRWPALIVRS